MARCARPLTSHCFAEKKVEGPVGGPSCGGTTIRRFPPTRMLLIPSSKPAAHTGLPDYDELVGEEQALHQPAAAGQDGVTSRPPWTECK